MGQRGHPGPLARGPVTREMVLSAALHLADSEGVENLSMRKLGRACGVEAMSLYHHVPDKAAVLDGLGDAVYAHVDLPDLDGLAWEEALVAIGRAMYDAFLRHPGALPVVATRPAFHPAGMRLIESVLSQLDRAGFSSVRSAWASRALGVYVVGSALARSGRSPVVPVDDSPGAWADRAASVDAERFPLLARAMSSAVESWDWDAIFDTGLRAMVDGLRLLATGAQPASTE